MMYSIAIKKEIKQITKPPGFVMDVIDKGDHLTLRVYEDEIMNLDFTSRLKAMNYLTTVEEVIKSHGIQCYSEGAKGVPRTIRRS